MFKLVLTDLKLEATLFSLHFCSCIDCIVLSSLNKKMCFLLADFLLLMFHRNNKKVFMLIKVLKSLAFIFLVCLSEVDMIDVGIRLEGMTEANITQPSNDARHYDRDGGDVGDHGQAGPGGDKIFNFVSTLVLR